MLGDTLPEEIEYEKEEQIVDHVKDILAWTTVLHKLAKIQKPFYVIGFNAKKKIKICQEVKTQNQAYEIIKRHKLESYVFADNVFKKFNIGE